jgi:pseudouridine synthase
VCRLPPRLVPVGRLDSATTGLLLVTNDGQWAQRVAHPSQGITKEYIVTSEAPVTRRALKGAFAG